MVLRFFLIAGIFLFMSCTEAERNNPDDPDGNNYRGAKLATTSSSFAYATPSSNSVASSSSATVSVTYTLTCTNLSPTGVASIAITRPVVKCNGDNVTPTFSGAPDWADPEEGSYNVSATANCGGNKTAECGSVEVGPPPTATELNCINLSPTGVAGTAITKPKVICGTTVIDNPIFTGAPTPSWENPNEGSYAVKASPTGDCKEAAACGTIKVSPKLNCAALTTTSVIAGTAVTPPAVTCGTTAVSAVDFAWGATPNQPDWNNPAAGTYSNIKAMATAGDCKDQTATCSGTLTVSNKLTCASVTQSIQTGAIPTLPKVTCGSTEVTSGITWSPTSINNAITTAQTISNVKATATCGGSSQTADCAGTITVTAQQTVSSSSRASSSSSVPSSSSRLSSSSVPSLPSSSSNSIQSGVVYGDDVPYQGVTYKTVVIGSQTWFQRNLNYAVAGSKCGNGSSLSDANTTTCDTYGRLYNWATAMALDASCNSSTCASQVSAKHRGICPSGWHIPSDADWDALMTAVGGSSTAGTKLKAGEGWEPYSGVPAGTDTYGFSALPGGRGYLGTFDNVGYYGRWWSASEYNSNNKAYNRNMLYNYEIANWDLYTKNNLFSVRCLQD